MHYKLFHPSTLVIFIVYQYIRKMHSYNSDNSFHIHFHLVQHIDILRSMKLDSCFVLNTARLCNQRTQQQVGTSASRSRHHCSQGLTCPALVPRAQLGKCWLNDQRLIPHPSLVSYCLKQTKYSRHADCG